MSPQAILIFFDKDTNSFSISVNWSDELTKSEAKLIAFWGRTYWFIEVNTKRRGYREIQEHVRILKEGILSSPIV